MSKEFSLYQEKPKDNDDEQLKVRKDVLTKTIINTLEERFGTGCLYLQELMEVEEEIKRREFNSMGGGSFEISN